MSLILEALRKSEAERRRGQTPDLLSEATPVVPPARSAVSRHWPWLVAIGATGSVLVATLLWWPRDALAPAAVAKANPDPAATARPSSIANSASPTRPNATPPVAASAAPVAKETPQAPGASGSRAPTAATGPATPAEPTVVASSAMTRPTLPASRMEPIAPPSERTPPTAPDEPLPAIETPAPAVASAVTFTSPDIPLRLSDLSGEDRRQLPPLKVSMHMWAPDIAQRFAIIDGNRVAEGDRVGDATIEAITQDAVMLAWRGRRVRLPIR